MKKKVVSGEATEKMNTLLEIIGEGFVLSGGSTEGAVGGQCAGSEDRR